MKSAKGQRSILSQKKGNEKSVNFDFKGAQKFFETANVLETLSILKPICSLSESIYRIKI